MVDRQRCGSEEARRAGIQETLLSSLFFISGFAALLYQLCWQRLLFGAFGIDLQSVTIVVSTFMLGLGVGSLLGGALADRIAGNLLFVFAATEAAIGVFGATSAWLLPSVADVFVRSPTATVAVVNFLLLLIPTTMMGATLPLLVAHEVRRRAASVGESAADGEVGAATGRLYFVNTMGAATGAFATAFLLFDHLTLDGVIATAASINGLVVLTALLFLRAPSRAVQVA
jgi:predicted membrane-bound spermidine synthase